MSHCQEETPSYETDNIANLSVDSSSTVYPGLGSHHIEMICFDHICKSKKQRNQQLEKGSLQVSFKVLFFHPVQIGI